MSTTVMMFLTSDPETAIEVAPGEEENERQLIALVVDRPTWLVDVSLAASARATAEARSAAKEAGLRLRHPDRMSVCFR